MPHIGKIVTFGPIFSSPVAGAAFSPSDVTGLALWLDANATYVTKDGGNNVSQWDDRSTNGLDMTQATGSQQPDWTDSQINGEPFIQFVDTNSDCLHRAISGWLGTKTTGTLYIVFQADTSDVPLWITTADEATNNFYMWFRTFTDAGSHYIGISAVQSASLTEAARGSTALVNGNNYIAGFESNDTAWNFRLNGADETVNVVTTANNGAWFGDVPNRDNIVIGATDRSSDVFKPAKIAEIVVYDNKISTQDRNDLETYLNNKYAVY